MAKDRTTFTYRDMDGHWQPGYLNNFLHLYGVHVTEVMKFFYHLYKERDEDAPEIKNYLHIHDLVDTEFARTLSKIDMREQTISALNFLELYKIFTSEFTQFCIMLQRDNGIPAEERNVNNQKFLESGYGVWPKEKISPKLGKLYNSACLYNRLRNNLAHGLVCKLEYYATDVAFEKFLSDHPGVDFHWQNGIVSLPDGVEVKEKNRIVRNIYRLKANGISAEFMKFSIKLFDEMHKCFFPDYYPPGKIKYDA